MPFLWQLVTTDGSIAGDRSSTVSCSSAIASGFRIPDTRKSFSGSRTTTRSQSNDPLRNPYTTVLERLRERLSAAAREGRDVRARGSVFNAIAEHVEGATIVNAGIEPLDSPIRMFASSMVCRSRPNRRGAVFVTTPSRSALRCTI